MPVKVALPLTETVQVIGTTPLGVGGYGIADFDEISIDNGTSLVGFLEVDLRTLVDGNTAKADLFDRETGLSVAGSEVTTTSVTAAIIKSGILTLPSTGQKRYQLRLYAGGATETAESTGGGILTIRRRLTGE